MEHSQALWKHYRVLRSIMEYYCALHEITEQESIVDCYGTLREHYGALTECYGGSGGPVDDFLVVEVEMSQQKGAICFWEQGITL